MSISFSATYCTSPNIALVKYWGKCCEENIIPLNTNVGLTLDTEDLKTITTVTLGYQTRDDMLILNDKSEKISNRIRKIVEFCRNKSPLKDLYKNEFN